MTETLVPSATKTRDGYTALQAPDGTWSILSLPVMGPLEVGARRNEEKIGLAWFRKAIERAEARKSEGYLAPAHILHHDVPGGTVRVGFFEPRSIGFLTYEGKKVPVVLADLTGIPEAIFHRIEAGELPYRSVEVFDWNEPEINSLALLPDEVPFFRFPNLKIAEKIRLDEGVESVDVKVFSDASPVRALLLAGSGGRALFRAEVETMTIQKVTVDDDGKTVVLPEDKLAEERADDEKKVDLADDDAEEKKDDEKMMEDKDSEELMEDEDSEKMMDEDPEKPEEEKEHLMEDEEKDSEKMMEEEESVPAWAKETNEKLDRLIELLGGDTVGNEEDSSPVEEPNRFSARKKSVAKKPPKEEKKPDAELAKLRGENVGLLLSNEAREKDQSLKDLVRERIEGLRAEGINVGDDLAPEMIKFAKSGLLDDFVSKLSETAVRDPSPTLDELENSIDPTDPEEVLKFHALGADALAAAREKKNEFDELTARGHLRGISLARYLEVNVPKP